MINFKKIRIKILLILLLLFFVSGAILFTRNNNNSENNKTVFRARLVEVIDGETVTNEDGSISTHQKLILKGLEGGWKDEEVVILDSVQAVFESGPEYGVGDKLLISHSLNAENNDDFNIIGFARQNSIYWLAALFVLVVVAIGRLKGLRALIVLSLTFLVILKFIVPRILAGDNPLLISIAGSLFILVLAVYITEGLKRTSTIAIFSILISLIITGLLSLWFTGITKLTGFASEEAGYLISVAGANVNIKGLLLAGIIIGALGVLDDVVISQVILVRELRTSNPRLSDKEIYQKAMKVGVSHLSSMVNTLFLAYAGASLPLLVLFGLSEPPFLTFSQVINHEVIATEIVRTLTGSTGLVLAVPIATLMAVRFIRPEFAKPEKNKEPQNKTLNEN